MKVKKEINVPTSSEDIPLEVYQKIITSDEKFKTDPYYVLALLCGVDPSLFKSIRAQDLDNLMSKAEKAMRFEGNKFIPFWNCEGVKYGFHPNLEDMTFAEITNLEKYMNEPENYHKAMSVCFRPVVYESKKLGGLYEIESYQGSMEYSEVMKKIPLSYFFGVRTFFLTIGNELNKITIQYSRKNSEKK